MSDSQTSVSPSQSPRLSGGHRTTQQHRKTVLVEDQLHQAKLPGDKRADKRASQSPRHSFSPSVNGSRGGRGNSSPPSRNSYGGTSPRTSDGLMVVGLDGKPPPSPGGSMRSERSSGASSLSDAISNLVFAPSSEHKILEELRKQMSANALRIRELEKEVKQIPDLNSRIEEVQRERGRLGNELLDQKEVVQLMKQRISMLHEQNGQLVKLVSVEKGGTGEILLMRNTLVASHAQLKRLQEQVNTIPALKSQVRGLSDENAKLRESEADSARQFPVKLPDGVELLDYKALWDENSELKATNQKLRDEVQTVEQHLATVTASCDSLRHRMEQFETTQVQISSLQERIKRLEADKAELNKEIIDLKLEPQEFPVSSVMDIDSTQLRREVATIQKNNAQLQSRLEQSRVDAEQQKEQLILKLFEFETLSVKMQKYELEKLVLGMDQIQMHSEALRSGTQSPDLNASMDDLNADESLQSLRDPPPELKMQLVGLNHLKIHGEQTRTLIQSLLADREALEKKVSDLSGRLDEGGVSELERKLVQSSSKLALARERVASLEKELQASVAAASSDSLEAENRQLRIQLAQIKSQENGRAGLEKSLKQMEEKVQDHDSQLRTLEKLKLDKHKAEKGLKKYKEKFRIIAQQLQVSVDLVKKYEDQCKVLNSELDQAKKDMESLREDSATAKAQLEVAEAEGAAKVTAVSSSENESESKGDAALAAELASLQVKFDEQKLGWEKDKAELAWLMSEASRRQEEEESLVRLRSVHSEVCSERDRLKQEVDSLRAAASSTSALEEQLSQATTEKERHAKEFSEQQEKMSELSEQVAALTTARNSAQSEVETLSAETRSLSQSNAELQAAKTQADTELTSKSAELDTVREKLRKVEKSLSTSLSLETSTTKRVVALESEVKSSKSHAGQLERERDSLRRQVEEQVGTISKMKSAAADSEKELRRLKDEVASSEGKVGQVQAELMEKTAALELVKKAKKELEDAAVKLRDEEVPRLQSDLLSAKQESERLASELKQKAAQLKEIGESSERGQSELQALQKSSEEEWTRKLALKEQSLKESNGRVKALEAKVTVLEKERGNLQTRYEKARGEIKHVEEQHQSCRTEVTRLQLKLEASMSALQSCPQCAQREKFEESQRRLSEQESQLQSREEQLQLQQESFHQEKKEITALRRRSEQLTNEVEGYKAMVENLTRNVEEADSIKGEYDILKQKFSRFEQALSESSQLKHDNRALINLLHETVRELPSFTSEANKDLQEDNLRLEQQVSVLSQWNDKHRAEIEALEHRLEASEEENHHLQMAMMAKENCEQENQLLKQELKEVEYEVSTLRRQVRADLQEELQVRLGTQSQLLTVFNQHNTSLQSQVVNLQQQVRTLGGALDREKPVSPPPMPEAPLPMVVLPAEVRNRTVTDVEKENEILKQRIEKLEAQLVRLQDVSVTVRRRSSTLSAMSSVPIAPINEDLQVNVPPDMLHPCALLADALAEGASLQASHTQAWLETICSEWFACMAQRSLSPTCAHCYITTLSRLSPKLLDIVLNLQDGKGNSALHYAAANGNFPVVAYFVRLRCCNASISNKAGYTPVMLAAACGVEVGEHRPIVSHLVSRGNVNAVAHQDGQTALMLAASGGSLDLVDVLLEGGADPNVQDKDGSTALMFACQNGHIGIVKRLLASPHCNTTLKDNDGCTAADIARTAGHSDISTILSRQR